MDINDKKIMEHELAGPVGKAVSQWMKKNQIMEPVSVTATVTHPSCYIDESGVAHNGALVVCNVTILDDDDFNDEYDD